MLNSRDKWLAIEQYITLIMGTKEKEDQQRQKDHLGQRIDDKQPKASLSQLLFVISVGKIYNFS